MMKIDIGCLGMIRWEKFKAMLPRMWIAWSRRKDKLLFSCPTSWLDKFWVYCLVVWPLLVTVKSYLLAVMSFSIDLALVLILLCKELFLLLHLLFTGELMGFVTKSFS